MTGSWKTENLLRNAGTHTCTDLARPDLQVGPDPDPELQDQGSPNSWHAALIHGMQPNPVSLPCVEALLPRQVRWEHPSKEGERRESMWDPLLEVGEVTRLEPAAAPGARRRQTVSGRDPSQGRAI